MDPRKKSKSGPERKTLIDVTEEKLRKECSQSSSPFLSPLSNIAQRWGISIPVVRQAAVRLRREGILQYKRGSRIRITSIPIAEVLCETVRSAERIEAALRQQLAGGGIGPYYEFPKIAVLAELYKVSSGTIITVFRMLSQNGLVHKRGRKWYAGPNPVENNKRYQKLQPPVILIIQESDETWSRFEHTPLLRRFFDAFNESVVRYGIRLISISADAHDTIQESTRYVNQRIRQLGKRFLGTLAVWNPDNNKSLQQLANGSLLLRKPFAWVQFHNTNPPSGLQSPLFARCYPSEERMAEMAIRFLHEYGHRNVAFALTTSDTSSWQYVRCSCVGKEAEKRGTEFHMLYAPVQERAAIKETCGGDLNYRRTLSYYPVLESLSAYPETTALIAPHDYTAFHLYRLFRLAGISIPRDLSLISFDNSLRIQPFGITSVDQGYRSLGTLTFNFISEYQPITRDNFGHISGQPLVVDRGSVDQPTKKAAPSVEQNHLRRIQEQINRMGTR